MVGIQKHYTIRPSRILIAILCASSLTLIFVLASLPFPAEWLVVAGFIIVGSTVYFGIREGTLGRDDSCVAFRLEREGEVTLMLRNGQHVLGKLSAGGVITPFLTMLNVSLGGEGRGRNILLLPDSMGATSFRHLRSVLRWDLKS